MEIDPTVRLPLTNLSPHYEEISLQRHLFKGPQSFADRVFKMAQTERKKKESIFDLSKFLDKPVRVKFQGGREASGVLKGYDPLLNLVLDNTTEYLRDPDDPFKLTDETRQLGLVVCRGTSVILVCPSDGMEPIANPFIQQEG